MQGENAYSDGDAGVATLPAVAVCVVLLVLTGLVVRLGAAAAARGRAESAADLGALAAASSVLRGQDAGCARASEVLARNGARLASCTWDGWDALVIAEVDSGFLGGTATGRARAGPAGWQRR